MSKKNKPKAPSQISSESQSLSQDSIPESPQQTALEEKIAAKKSKKELLNTIVQKGKNVGKNVKSTVKTKVKKVAENEMIATNLKKLTPSTAAERQKLKGIFLILVGLVALLFVGGFFVYKIFRPQPLAELLPADTTVGLLEVNTDGNSAQLQQFFHLLRNHPAYQPDQLVKLFNFILPVDYQTQLAPWFGRKVGVALVTSAVQNGTLTPIVFIETKDQQKALSFFQSLVLKNSNDELITQNYDGHNFYTYRLSQPYSFFFLNNYVVLAGSRALLIDLYSQYKNSKVLLTDEENYRKVANNLPSGGLAFGYVNVAKFFEELVRNPTFTTREARELILLQPFLQLFSAKGLSVSAGEKALQFQVFSSLDKKALNGATYLTYSDKYQGRLLDLADPDALMFAGGQDVTKELNRLDEIFTAGTKTSSLLFQGILEAQKQQYLGKDISLSDDIYPLLKGEYLVTLTKDLAKPEIAVLLQLKDKNNDSLHFEKIINAFIKKSAIFEPKIQDVTLPDGTKGQEVVASPEQVTRSDEVYEGINITSLQIGNSGWNVYYAISGNNLLIATSKDGLERMLDRSMGKSNNGLSQSDTYRHEVAPIFSSADEVMYTQIQPLLKQFASVLGLRSKENENAPINANILPYLEPWTSLSSTKNFFDDGISELYLLGIDSPNQN